MKRIIKKIFGGFFNNHFKKLAEKKLKNISKDTIIYFFDIDNTLADTKGVKHLTNVTAFPKMISLVKEKAAAGKVFFLTARNITTYSSTVQWLNRQELGAPAFDLIFLTAPHEKLPVLQAAINMGFTVEYYDDLCYNHENNDIKKYDDVINAVARLNLKYNGIDDFVHLQQ